jgi:hypothetical protein
LCYKFGVQGEDKEGLFGNSKTVRVQVSVTATWAKAAHAAELLDLRALRAAAKQP